MRAPISVPDALRFGAIAVLACLSPAGGLRVSFAQSTEYTLTDQGKWDQTRAPAPGSDDAVMAQARRLLGENQPGEAEDLLDEWIDNNVLSNSPYLPAAYLLRGDAKLALEDEYDAIYDYETVIKRYPQSEEFKTAVERELEIGIRYANGLKRKVLGIRFLNADDDAVELLIRVQERLPGSALAERAAIELGDFYFRQRNMKLAAEAYDLYLTNFPNGPNRMKAMVGRILANIALFKGPEYDTSSLSNALIQVRGFMRAYPAEAERRNMDASLIARIEESLAAQMLVVAEWYLSREDLPSARLQLRRLVRKHPQSGAAARAIDILYQHAWLEEGTPAPGNEQSGETTSSDKAGPAPTNSAPSSPGDKHP